MKRKRKMNLLLANTSSRFEKEAKFEDMSSVTNTMIGKEQLSVVGREHKIRNNQRGFCLFY